MQALKRLFYGICIVVILFCAGILLCALQPSLTQSLAEVLYGASGDTTEGGVITLPGEDSSLAGENDVGIDEPLAVPGMDETQTHIDPEQISAENGVLTQDNGYQPPNQEELRLPEQVAERTGYQPVQEQAEEVAGEEAENLQSSLSTGTTGEELAFDSNLYPYYAMLDAQRQQLYRQIYANANDLQKTFAPVVEVNVNQLKNVFEAVCNDHPELFWLETGYSCKYRPDGGCVEITLSFNRLADDLNTARNTFETQVQNLLSGAKGLGSDYEKEKYVHDALLTRVEYNTRAELSQSAYSALVNGQSVCAGYARAFQYLMQQLGIPCYYCTGYSGENHAWNIIKLRDDYYNVDTTWDDTTPSTYDYFNRTDGDYASTHVRQGLSVYLPACNGTALRGLESGRPQTVVGVAVVGDGTATPTPQATEAPAAAASPSPTPLPGPLTWNPTPTSAGTSATPEPSDALTRAGYSASDVCSTMESYYADCLRQMAAAGAGQRQFTNIIPASLWSAVERAYSDGSYQTGYVNSALQQIGMGSFAIQLQADALGDDYYILYHNISSWN